MRLLVSPMIVHILKVRCFIFLEGFYTVYYGMASLNDRAMLKIVINSEKTIVTDLANSSAFLLSLISTTTSLFFHQWNKTEPAFSRVPQTVFFRSKVVSIHFAPLLSTSLFFWRCSSPALIITQAELDDCNVSEYTILIITFDWGKFFFILNFMRIHTYLQATTMSVIKITANRDTVMQTAITLLSGGTLLFKTPVVETIKWKIPSYLAIARNPCFLGCDYALVCLS